MTIQIIIDLDWCLAFKILQKNLIYLCSSNFHNKNDSKGWWWTGQGLPVLTLPCVVVRKVVLPVPTSWEPCPPVIGTGLLWGDLDEVVKLIVGGVYLVVHYR